MTNQIVTVSISEIVGAAPNTLQRTGAFISQGATTGTTGSLELLTQLSDLTPILAGGKAISTMVWASTVVTVTTTAPHGWTIADVIPVTISGVVPAGYNGVFQATITGTSTFTYPLASSPGSVTTQGVATLEDVTELTAMATTFFGQGSGVSVYVLELGEGTVTEGVAALGTFITANPGEVYRWLVPREWDADSDFLALIAEYEALSAKVKFHVTTTIDTYSAYTALMNNVMAWVEAPSIPSTEFSAAADFYVTLNYNPSPAANVPPNAFAFLFGVTPYPTRGTQALLAALKAAKINYVGTGAEGGISNTIVFWGTMADGHDVLFGYSVDWVQINLQQAIANAIINGSNNPQAPLYYNQPGINTLQAVAQSVMNSGVALGLVLGNPQVTAISFATYVTDNPDDYPAGVYNGLAVTFTPNRGFTSITFFVTVSDIPTNV